MGVRFQLKPGGAYNDGAACKTLAHDKLAAAGGWCVRREPDCACFNYQKPGFVFAIINMEHLSRDRLQIDMIRFEGPDFLLVDNRLMSLYLVRYGFSDVAVFGPDGKKFTTSGSIV